MVVFYQPLAASARATPVGIPQRFVHELGLLLSPWAKTEQAFDAVPESNDNLLFSQSKPIAYLAIVKPCKAPYSAVIVVSTLSLKARE